MQVRVQPQHGLFLRAIKGAVAVMTFVILASVIGTCVLCGKAAHDVGGKSRERSEADQRALSTVPPIDISASDLEAAYRTNEVSADDLYKDHVLRVLGVVERISKDILDDPHVILRSEHMFGGVTCSFGNDADAAVAGLAPGQRVVLRGIGAGYFMGGPMLRRCVIDSAVGPACRVPSTEGMNGGTAMGECRDASVCVAPSVYYQGFCQGPANIVCCVLPPAAPPPSPTSPAKRPARVRSNTAQPESDTRGTLAGAAVELSPPENPPEKIDCSATIRDAHDKDCVAQF